MTRIALLALIRLVSACVVFEFQTFHDLVYDGDVIQTHRHLLVGADDCRRACMLTSGCRGFNMQWLRTPGDVGYCTLTAMQVKMATIPKQNYTLYGK